MTKSNILKYLDSAFRNHKMFESILFESNNSLELNDTVNEVIRYLYCENNSLINDNCDYCIKFEKGQILDFRTVGDGLLSIDKKTIQELISDMSSTAIDDNKPKVALIKNAENLKVDASNSLLKFLEEPTNNTYFFLISNDKNNVLPTIKSRSKILTINEDVLEPVDNYIVKVIRLGNKDNILLMNNKMKKRTKEELIQDLKEALGNFLNPRETKIYELILSLIEDVKFNNNLNLAIDNFLIKVVGD